MGEMISFWINALCRPVTGGDERVVRFTVQAKDVKEAVQRWRDTYLRDWALNRITSVVKVQ